MLAEQRYKILFIQYVKEHLILTFYTTSKAAGAAEMICQNGMVNGYPVLVTNYMDADSIGFGVFSNAAIGQFGDMDLVIDPYTGAKSNVVNFVLNTDYDIVVARPEAFAIAKKKASA